MSEPLLKLFGGGPEVTATGVDKAVRNGVSQTDLQAVAITQGVFLTAELAATTELVLSHGLNRVPQGMIPVDIKAVGFPVIKTVAQDSSTITLEADAAGTVIVWVF